jgi:hypothetical protein
MRPQQQEKWHLSFFLFFQKKYAGDLLLNNKKNAAIFLEAKYDTFFEKFFLNMLKSTNYVTKRALF